jgi:hypothetical protein
MMHGKRPGCCDPMGRGGCDPASLESRCPGSRLDRAKLLATRPDFLLNRSETFFRALPTASLKSSGASWHGARLSCCGASSMKSWRDRTRGKQLSPSSRRMTRNLTPTPPPN